MNNHTVYSFPDWVTVRIPYRHSVPLNNEEISRINRKTGEILYKKSCWESFESEASSSDRVGVMSVSYADLLAPFEKLYKQGQPLRPFEQVIMRYHEDLQHAYEGFLYLDVSFNPTKYIQGMNVWGCNDKSDVLRYALKLVLNQLYVWTNMSDEERTKLLNLEVYVTRFDLTTNIGLQDVASKHHFLKGIADQAESKRGTPSTIHTTTYFGRADYLQIKFYDKLAEMMSNKPKLGKNPTSKHRDEVLKYSDFLKEIINEIASFVRVEMRIGRAYIRDKNLKMLKDLIKHIDEHDCSVNGGLLMNKVKGLKLGQMPLNDKGINEAKEKIKLSIEAKQMPSGVLGIFIAWEGGERIKDIMTKSLYHHYCKLVKGLTGIDMKCVRAKKLKADSNIIPLIRVVEASTCSPSSTFDKYIYPKSIYG